MKDPTKRYQGKPCRHGHGTERFKSTRACVECARLKVTEWNNKPGAKEKNTAKKAKWYTQNREKQRDTYFKYKYGIGHDEYEAMFATQKGVCAICLQPETRGANRLSVDHNHETGKVRALLCGGCNTSLGLMAENPERLRKAADYLEHFHEG